MKKLIEKCDAWHKGGLSEIDWKYAKKNSSSD